MFFRKWGLDSLNHFLALSSNGSAAAWGALPYLATSFFNFDVHVTWTGLSFCFLFCIVMVKFFPTSSHAIFIQFFDKTVILLSNVILICFYSGFIKCWLCRLLIIFSSWLISNNTWSCEKFIPCCDH